MTKAYPAYRDSGVEWLGKVPDHWTTTALKRVAFLQSGSTITAETIEAEGTYPVFGGNGLRGYTEEFTHDGEYPLIGRQGALCGNVNYAKGRFWASEHAIVVSQRKPFAVTWMGELLRAMNLGQYTTSAAQPGIAVEIIGELPVLLPPLPEQTAIAAFLDRETAKIDALVAEQRRLIDLLREKRQAVISNAVTKGLNPNAPLKPSGIDWLGDVPEGWVMLSLRYLVDERRPITYGIVQPGPSDPTGRYMVRGQDYSFGWANPTDIFRVSQAVEEPYRRARLKSGDIVITIVGAGVGNLATVPDFLDGANITQTTARIAPNLDRVASEFLRYSLSSRVGQTQVALYQKGAAQPGLNLEHLSAFMIPLPPIHAQAAIIEHLDDQLVKFDPLLTSAASTISLLQERRAALISAAVTGKIDVRENMTDEVAA